MDRKDFVERGEVKVDFLKYYRLVSRWACKEHGLNIADLELLFYLDPLKYFTVVDFKDGTLYYSWDPKRFYRLQNDEWITKIHHGGGKVGGKSKYTTSTKARRLIGRIYKMLIGKEDIPESTRRNNIMKGGSYSEKVLRQAIKKFNKDNL